MSIEFRKIVDISLELDPKNFAMRTPAGFKKDMQFEMEVIKCSLITSISNCMSFLNPAGAVSYTHLTLPTICSV